MENTLTNMVLIFNPTAAKGTALEKFQPIVDSLNQLGFQIEYMITEYVGHARELAYSVVEKKRSSKYMLVAAGGDGTIHEVVNGLMEAHASGFILPTFSVIPIGRGNDFAYGIGLRGSWSDTLELFTQGTFAQLDIGQIIGGDYPQGKFFANGVGIGFDTRVGLEANKMTWVKGFLSYVFGALKTFLIYPKAPYFVIRFNEQIIQQQSHQVSIMNGQRMGGAFFMAPEGSMFDGQLDLCLAGKLGRISMAKALAMFMKGTQKDHPQILFGRSFEFSLFAPQGGMLCHADGETICLDGSELTVRVLPGAITCFIPQNSRGE